MQAFFEKLINWLETANIPYMLSGSVAMSLYVMPRSTRDFDFVIHLQEKDINQLVERFKDGFYCDEDAIRDAVKQKGLFNIIDHESGFKADFVLLKNDLYRQTEFRRRIQKDFFGKKVYIVTPEDLLISKLIWIQDLQSAVQSEDIKNLAAIEELDHVYIKYWIAMLKLRTFNLLENLR